MFKTTTEMQIKTTIVKWQTTFNGAYVSDFKAYLAEIEKLKAILLNEEDPTEVETFLKTTPTARMKKTWAEHLKI